VSSTPGPEYATQQNTAFTTIDSHDHTSGKGLQVPSSGLNINADLPFNLQNATAVRSVRFNNYGTAIGAGTDTGCAYVAGGNLYFNDISGTQIQLTAGGALNAASIGGIGGDYSTSTASVYYSDIAKTFYFTQNINQAATVSVGPVVIQDTAVSANGITVQSPVALAASYSLTLPSVVPASTLPISMSSTGVMSTGQITTAQITDNAVTTVKIPNAAVTPEKLTALNYAQSSVISSFTLSDSSAYFTTGMSLSLTTNGRPVFMSFINDGTRSGFFRSNNSVNATSISDTFQIEIRRNGTVISNSQPSINANLVGSSNIQLQVSPGSFSHFDPVSAGTYTYEVFARISSNASPLLINNVIFYAYEL
jgi:hypothetical protein